jgi:surfactin synthase thioesterase subunit
LTISKWLRQYGDGTKQCRIICFPFAGGSADYYRFLSHGLSGVADVYAVQLPGRRDRKREKPVHSVREIIDQLAPILSNFSEGNSIFFGHSLGAILAYEMATRLQKDSGSGPQHVIVSGHNAPDQPSGYVPISDLPTAAFFRELNSLGGMDPNVFGNEELMDLMEPALRSDIKANEDYRRMTNQRLLCHLSIWGGLCDPFVSHDALREWQPQCNVLNY